MICILFITLSKIEVSGDLLRINFPQLSYEWFVFWSAPKTRQAFKLHNGYRRIDKACIWMWKVQVKADLLNGRFHCHVARDFPYLNQLALLRSAIIHVSFIENFDNQASLPSKYKPNFLMPIFTVSKITFESSFARGYWFAELYV